MTRSVTITFIIFMSVAIITLISKTYAFLGFWWSDESGSISSFIPANSIDQTSVMLAQSSMSLLGQTTIINSNSGNDEFILQWGSSLSTVSPLLSYDLIAAVQSNNNANDIITKHITKLNQATILLTQQSRNYQSQLEQSQSKLTNCSLDKKTTDTSIIEAINSNELQNINSLIQASVRAGQCEIQHRITINTLTLIINKYTQAIFLLTKKVNLIEQHNSVIAQYPEVIADPEIIKELNQVSSQF